MRALGLFEGKKKDVIGSSWYRVCGRLQEYLGMRMIGEALTHFLWKKNLQKVSGTNRWRL